MIGLAALAIIAVVGWLLMDMQLQVEDTETADAGPVVATAAPEVLPADAQAEDKGATDAAPAGQTQPAPIVREQAPAEPSKPAPAKQEKAQPAPAGEQKPAAAETKTAEPSPVLRTYSDSLKGGGRGPVMVSLAAASYQMGSTGGSMNSSEVPRHEVQLPAFSISKHEVTFAEYDRFAGATGKRRPKDEGWGRKNRPVINVSWEDAQAYVKWLSAQTGKTYRLPSEAQWEYAARAGSEGSYWWSGVHEDTPANCFNCGSEWDGARTAPVGQFAANAFGLHDMTGNVQEWTEDCYNSNYKGAPADGSAWVTPLCEMRVIRGGAYSSPQDSLRTTKRTRMETETRLDNLGFRVVRVD